MQALTNTENPRDTQDHDKLQNVMMYMKNMESVGLHVISEELILYAGPFYYLIFLHFINEC